MFDKDGSFVVMKLEQVCLVAARTRRLLLTLWTVTPAFVWPGSPPSPNRNHSIKVL